MLSKKCNLKFEYRDMKYLFLVLMLAGITYSFVYLKRKEKSETKLLEKPVSFYSLSIESIDGQTIDFSQFKGKKVICVNVASKCGHTPQYSELEKLYQKYKDKLVIIAFPCNQFLFQEPGSNKDIQEFCTKNYGITFLLTSKIDVKGSGQHPVYQWLTSKAQNEKMDSEVKWNFQKYLINENGEWVTFFDSKIQPMDPSIIAAIEK